MSLPDPTPPRKLSRWPLYGPFALLFIFMIGWSAVWIWARGEAVRRIDAGAQGLRKAGYELSWRERAVGGYPFRLNVTLTEPRLRDPSGWALEAPVLEGQAFMHAPTSWIIAAPQGLTFMRPVGGPVRVQGRLVRASLTHLTSAPPSFSFEGTGLTFQPAAGANPFSLSAAERVEIHLRRAPAAVGDEAGVWVSVEGGKAQLSGLLGRLAADKPVALQWDMRLSKISALRGSSWAEAVRAWSDAGGVARVPRAGLTAGDALIGVTGGELGVDTDGRVKGRLDLTLRQAPRAFDALETAGLAAQPQIGAAAAVVAARQGKEDVARAPLYFEAGRTTLGPISLWPAPRVYERR